MPVQYKDLGKAAKDLFEKNYKHGKYSLEVKSKSGHHEFTTKGSQKHADGSLSSSFEHKMKLCKLGTLKSTAVPGKDKVNYDLENKDLVKDAKFNFLFDMGIGGCPCPNPTALKMNYSHEKVNLDLESNLATGLKVSAVADLPKIPFLIGFNGNFDLNKINFDNRELAWSMNKGSMEYVGKTSFKNDMSCSILNKINADLTMATQINHDAKSGTALKLGAISKGSCGSSNQFRIDNTGKFAISHITPSNLGGGKLTVSGEFDAFNLGGGSHKMGWGLKFDL